MDLPLISIVIPCYNAEVFLGEAIESALAQTYRHREVIVIDDGSTDGSLDVIRSFGDFVKWRSGPNRGGSAARNTGLALAAGKYVQFLDADDVLHPAKVALQSAVLDETGADICVNRFRIVQDVAATVGGPKGGPTATSVDWFLASDIRLSGLYRLEVVRNVGGFDEQLPCCQDFDLNLRIALYGAMVVYLGEVLYEYRRRPASVSSDEVRLYRTMAAVLSRVARSLRGPNDKCRAEREALAAKASSAARWLLRLGDTAGGLAAFEIAGNIHPSAGLASAYSVPALALRSVLGPAAAERVLWRLRNLAHEYRSTGIRNG